MRAEPDPVFTIFNPDVELSDEAISALASLILDVLENNESTPDPQTPASGSDQFRAGIVKGGHKNGTHDESQWRD